MLLIVHVIDWVASQKGDYMQKIVTLGALFLVCTGIANSQTPKVDPFLITDARYAALLSQIKDELPKWQATLKSINLENPSSLPYSQGKSIADDRTVALTEIDGLRAYIILERGGRTIAGELMLMTYLNHLFEESQEIMWRGAVNGLPPLPLKQIDQYGPEIKGFSESLFGDIHERVYDLEKRNCP